MIGLLTSDNAHVDSAKYVESAIIRSVTRSQYIRISTAPSPSLLNDNISILVMISPTVEQLDWALGLLNIDKIIILGYLPDSISNYLLLEYRGWPKAGWDKAPVAKPYHSSESDGYIRYNHLAHEDFDLVKDRPFERFDFMDEWNNLGYGAITADKTIWSICQPVLLSDEYSLATVTSGDEKIATYAALCEINNKSVLWFNREVGPIDSYEWHFVEEFITSYKSESSSCLPILTEIPQGYDSAVTMRLDCDEDVESSRFLWNVYQEENVPFSLAIHTKNLENSKNFSIISELDDFGGAILSHTATHAPNWGGSYESAVIEAKESAEKIATITGKTVDYIVSPFHHTPIYALKALSDMGYLGCIGGIIKNDPEFLSYKGGNLADLPNDFIGHSQQVMLHGDCLLRDTDDILKVYKESFDLSYHTQTLFGYLDHPFSERYQYGWETEEQRAKCHRELLNYIRSNTKNVCFLNEIEAMNFIYDRSNISMILENNQIKISYPKNYIPKSIYIPSIRYKKSIILMDIDNK
ncbi:polysaccharide deacetylase family protein [Vibrio sp. MEBiC08052]|uniref:polysaccharide deacetylase family protein n=1 Tax=Vibrio sp. MEBiC08052 TaxID=1761910 RepID=UPI0007405A34|nr:polysaccharide deacetylase family protein [Vibrio sp. MEBiC08052]KUJ00606.1 hypothetical protein VRK_01080 [Vibrio sp. MEBiC08052]